jgi:hypothetical protein
VVGVDPEEPDYPVVRYREGSAFTEVARHIVDGVVQTCDAAAAPEPTPLPTSQPAAWRPAA